MFEFPLQFLELAGNSLVISRELLIGVFETLVFFLILGAEVSVSSVEDTLLLLQLLVVLVVLLLLLLQDLQVVVQLLRVQLVERLHLLVALLQILDVVLHLDLGAGEGLHTLHPQFLNCLLELLLLTTSALGEGTLHVDMFLEAFIHLRLGLLDVGLALSLKTTLDFL